MLQAMADLKRKDSLFNTSREQMYSNDINDENYDEGNESKDSIKMINRTDNDYSDNNSEHDYD